jgi:CRP-like cAMP-binding protein
MLISAITNMEIQDYFIQEKLGYEEPMPFEIHRVNFKKGEMTLEEGQIENNIYFIVSGKVASVMTTAKDEERVVDFAFAGELYSSLSSMLKQKPSDISLICLSKCVMQVIPYDGLKEACKTSIFANTFFNHFLQFSYLKRVQKEKDNLTKDPEQRYIGLLQSRPNLMQELPMAYVAKYLGIHPNSLGRIRKRLIENEKLKSSNKR